MPEIRNFIGYGNKPPQLTWENNSKLAIQFVLNYEEVGENTVLNDDEHSEVFLSEIIGAQPVIGDRHMNMESIYEYGSRVGFWRIHNEFTKRGLPLTIFGVGLALEKNKDVVKLPSDIATEELTWETLNRPAQNWVRKYLIAYSKEGLGRIYSKFSGDLQVPDSQIKLDYTSLLTEGKDEKLKLLEELMNRLERLRPDKMLERKGNEAENLNKSLKYRPIQSPFNMI